MSDPDEDKKPSEAQPDTPLEKTTPQMKLEQRGVEREDLEWLDETTPQMREFMGSQDRPRRRS